MDEVTCIQSDKITDWMVVFYVLNIKHDIPDESWVYMKNGIPGDKNHKNENVDRKVKCETCPKRIGNFSECK